MGETNKSTISNYTDKHDRRTLSLGSEGAPGRVSITKEMMTDQSLKKEKELQW